MPPSLDLVAVTPDSVNPSVPDSSGLLPFTSDDRKGVLIMAVAGLVSCALVSLLLLHIIASGLLLLRRPNPTAPIPAPFLTKRVAVFVVCLLTSDLIQSVSGVLQWKWGIEMRIYEGPPCLAQAVTMLMGDLGSTVWSCVIASHTFCSLALGKQWSRRVVTITAIVGWAVIILLTVIGPTVFESPDLGPFFGIAGEWCFITSHYPIHRLVIHYVPLFIASVIIVVFYGLVFLILRGSLGFGPFRFQSANAQLDDIFLRERIIIAKRMLWYPIAYVTCMFPIAIIRIVGLRSKSIPNSVWTVGMFFLFLLGAIDSVIYATTRNLVKPFRPTVHLNTFGSDGSGTSRNTALYVGSPRKSNSSDVDSPRNGGTVGVDMKMCAQVYEMVPSTPLTPRECGDGDGRKTAAIRVTLERIEEIR